MFSATISREVMDISWVYQRDPVEIVVRPVQENRPQISQYRLKVDMGAPCFDPGQIPVASGSNRLTLDVDGHALRFFCVSMGNPHAVTFDLYPDDETFHRLGPLLETHAAFPRRANVEFCRVNERGGADVRVWERGDGPTLACGTGACAVLAAGASLGLLPRAATIVLPGGSLDIRWADDGHVFMTGPAEEVFRGEWRVESEE